MKYLERYKEIEREINKLKKEQQSIEIAVNILKKMPNKKREFLEENDAEFIGRVDFDIFSKEKHKKDEVIVIFCPQDNFLGIYSPRADYIVDPFTGEGGDKWDIFLNDYVSFVFYEFRFKKSCD